MTEGPDDWKGEHLIRNIQTVSAYALSGSKVGEKYCRHEGCKKRLDPRNKSGYCMPHKREKDRQADG